MSSIESQPIDRAGAWLLDSGIQNPDGGVARYFRTDIASNVAVSTEITGYAVSAFCLLFEESADERYLAAAKRAGDFLMETWNPDLKSMPFEIGGHNYSYFFDCGIIARGLLWLWRSTREEKYLARAKEVGESMDRDFRALQGFHPRIKLPCKSPEDHSIWWSQMPGAFHLKAALAWRDLADALPDGKFDAWYEEALEFSLRRYPDLLDNERDEMKKMDRLHAWAYFLEGLQAVKQRTNIQLLSGDALARGESLLEHLAPLFVRSDVCAQLLRLRLLYGGAAFERDLDRIRSFQYVSEDARLNGGFGFGTRNGETMPFANPVSTIFAIQALIYARDAAGGAFGDADWRKLI